MRLPSLQSPESGPPEYAEGREWVRGALLAPCYAARDAQTGTLMATKHVAAVWANR